MALNATDNRFNVENCRTTDISVWYLTRRHKRIEKRIARGRERKTDFGQRERVAKQLADARKHLCS